LQHDTKSEREEEKLEICLTTTSTALNDISLHNGSIKSVLSYACFLFLFSFHSRRRSIG
jgi:hypothetical protein